RDVPPGKDGKQLTVLPEVAPVVALSAAGLDDRETLANGSCDGRLRRFHRLGWRSGRGGPGEISRVNRQGFLFSIRFRQAAYSHLCVEPPLLSSNSACTIIRTTSGML